MASIKQIAAIALTLIIAVPIIMGYAMASTEETTTAWTTDSTDNATDLLFNHYSDYYMDYYDPNNNAMIYQQYVNQGGTSYSIVAPDYTAVGSNYTSLAEYTEGSQSVSLTAATEYTYTGEGGSTVGWGDLTSGANYLVPSTAGIYISVSSTAPTPIHWTIQFDSSYYNLSGLDGTWTIDLLRDSGTTWTAVVTENGTVTTYPGISTWIMDTDADYDVTIYTRGYTSIDIDGTIAFTAPAYSVVLLDQDGTNTYLPVTSATSVTKLAGGYTTVGGSTYSGVDSISLVAPQGYSTISVTYSTASGSYADPADGWAIPDSSATSWYSWWMNGQENSEVRVFLEFTSTDTAILGPTDSAVTAQLVTIAYDGSGITVNGSYLGAYSSVLAVVTDSGTTVYGVSGWPAMGAAASTFNSVAVSYTDLDNFEYISMSDTNGDVLYRVDYASIVAGTYPATKDLTLDLSEKYPAQSLTFTLKSIALYGDSVSFGGTAFTVTDGKISGTDADGESFTVTLRGAVVRYVYGDSGYTVSVGGHELTGTAGTVYFGGEWSLTSSISLISQTTSTQQVWAQGEFAFDKEDFAACGLLVAGACLVGLGMTGSRSGIKMGVLLIICGGAGLIYLTII